MAATLPGQVWRVLLALRATPSEDDCAEQGRPTQDIAQHLETWETQLDSSGTTPSIEVPTLLQALGQHYLPE